MSKICSFVDKLSVTTGWAFERIDKQLIEDIDEDELRESPGSIQENIKKNRREMKKLAKRISRKNGEMILPTILTCFQFII